MQFLADHFWSRWLSEYLSLLQPRRKWHEASDNLKIGDLVIMKDEQVSRGCWSKAVVTLVMPDKQGLIRRVKVRTGGNKTFIKDIGKLCQLEDHIE